MATKREPLVIKDILSDLLKQPEWDKKIHQYTLWNHWVTIVGEEVARHAKPHAWRGETLVIHVDHSTWLQELKMKEPEIREQIKKLYPDLALKEIHWKLKT